MRLSVQIQTNMRYNRNNIACLVLLHGPGNRGTPPYSKYNLHCVIHLLVQIANRYGSSALYL